MAKEPARARDLLSDLRHELRTPLNHIIGYGEILREEAEEAGQSHMIDDLKKVDTAARRMLGILDAKLRPEAHGTPTMAISSRKSEAPLVIDGSSRVPSRRPAAPGGHLLVVDDSAMNREVFRRHLERQGHTVSMAENGRQALEAMARDTYDVVLLDIIMPEADGYGVLERMKADDELRHIPVIMISALDELDSVVRCIEIGADDYLPKPFQATLLGARIGACIEKKQLRDQEQRTHRALVESERRLAKELAEAADYVRSLLPPPVSGEVSAEWRFLPSAQLGGDALGYHWLDDDHFAIYLLDVCGHGVGAALLSISVMNVLRSQTLPATDLRRPGEVLNALNGAFRMEEQNNMYFTIWYGVYRKPDRRLLYASGGHPPAALIHSGTIHPLATQGRIIGYTPGVEFEGAECSVSPGSKLCVFSDGVYELTRPDGSMVTLSEFLDQLASDPGLDAVIEASRAAQGKAAFEDDFSILKVSF